MTHPLKTAAKILAISATLSMHLMSTSANAALNFGINDTSADAKPAYSGQQFAAFVKLDRDRNSQGRNDDNGRNEGHGNDGGNEGHGNDDGHGGNDGDGHDDGDDGDDGDGHDDD